MDSVTYDAIRKAEVSFIAASFAAKVPLLALFWYSTANTDFDSDGFDLGAGLIVGIGFFLALVGVVFFTCYRDRCGRKPAPIDDETLKKYHGWAGLLLTATSVAMFGYIGDGNNGVFDEPRAYGTVVNTYAVWTELPGDAFKISPVSEEIGGGVPLPALPPIFGLVSGLQHLWSWRNYDTSTCVDTYGGAWLPRVVDYALSTPFIFLTTMFFFDAEVTLLSILLMFAFYSSLMFTGYATEVAWAKGLDTTVVYAPFIAGSVGFLLSWIGLLIQLEGGVRESSADTPWFVYAFTAWVFASFCFFPVITLQKVTGGKAVTGGKTGYRAVKSYEMEPTAGFLM